MKPEQQNDQSPSSTSADQAVPQESAAPDSLVAPQPQAVPREDQASTLGVPQTPGQMAPSPIHHVDPTTVILQWLTYAFWGWTILALSFLTTLVINSYVNSNDSDGFTTYGIAAVLVLLPISYVCDHFYSKKEAAKKTGIELILMVIHAVLFALFGIGSLIWAVISVVTLLTSTENPTGSIVSLTSALVMTVFYLLTFVRTINFDKLSWFTQKYRVVMLVTVGIIALLGILGPVAKEINARDDRLIENNLSNLQTAVNDYVKTNDKLPASLNALSLNGTEKQLVERSLVTYKPEGTNTITTDYLDAFSGQRTQKTHKYQLCVTFKYASSGSYRSNSYAAVSSDYSSYLSAYDHPAGEVCYKLQAEDY